MDILYVLDAVLKWFATDENKSKSFIVPDIILGIAETYPIIAEDAINFNPIISKCLKRLQEDGYIETVSVYYANANSTRGEMQITFNGLVWAAQKGYQGRLKRDTETETRSRNSYFLTWILALGSLGILIVEILKYWRWVGSIELWTAFFVLLACNLTGLIIWQLVLYLKE